MTMQVTVKGVDEARVALDGLQGKIITPELMSRVSAFLLTKIKERTLEGKDYRGAPFAAYSAKYAAFREMHGRPNLNVSLFFTGQMQAAMTYRLEGLEKSVLFFAGARQAAKASGLDEGVKKRGLPSRPFFRVSEGDAKDIVEQCNFYLREVLGNA